MRGDTIIVTGATSGIGREAAVQCALAGANVVACGRRRELGEALVHELRAQGAQACFVEADVSIGDDVQRVVDVAVETYGSLEYAFNNAGVFRREPQLHEYEDDAWQEHLAIGLTGVYLCMKYQLRAMLQAPARHRAIVNNASTVGARGSVASGAGYTAVKHGILGLTRQAAVEYAHTDIRINALCPGPTLSDATAPLLDMDETALSEYLSSLNPTAKLVPATDIAASLIFLCSPAAGMINGQALALDGGQWARL